MSNLVASLHFLDHLVSVIDQDLHLSLKLPDSLIHAQEPDDFFVEPVFVQLHALQDGLTADPFDCPPEGFARRQVKVNQVLELELLVKLLAQLSVVTLDFFFVPVVFFEREHFQEFFFGNVMVLLIVVGASQGARLLLLFQLLEVVCVVDFNRIGLVILIFVKNVILLFGVMEFPVLQIFWLLLVSLVEIFDPVILSAHYLLVGSFFV